MATARFTEVRYEVIKEFLDSLTGEMKRNVFINFDGNMTRGDVLIEAIAGHSAMYETVVQLFFDIYSKKFKK